MMTEHEVKDLQRRIDEGILLAQKRLWEKARTNHQSLVVARGGKVLEIFPE